MSSEFLEPILGGPGKNNILMREGWWGGLDKKYVCPNIISVAWICFTKFSFFPQVIVAFVRNTFTMSVSFSPAHHRWLRTLACSVSRAQAHQPTEGNGAFFGISHQAEPTSHTFTSDTSHSVFQRLTVSGLYFSYGPLSCIVWQLFTYIPVFPGKGKRRFLSPIFVFPVPKLQNLKQGSHTLISFELHYDKPFTSE